MSDINTTTGGAPAYERAAFLKAMHEQNAATGTNAVERAQRSRPLSRPLSQPLPEGCSPYGVVVGKADEKRHLAQLKLKQAAEHREEDNRLYEEAVRFDAEAAQLRAAADRMQGAPADLTTAMMDGQVYRWSAKGGHQPADVVDTDKLAPPEPGPTTRMEWWGERLGQVQGAMHEKLASDQYMADVVDNARQRDEAPDVALRAAALGVAVDLHSKANQGSIDDVMALADRFRRFLAGEPDPQPRHAPVVRGNVGGNVTGNVREAE